MNVLFTRMLKFLAVPLRIFFSTVMALLSLQGYAQVQNGALSVDALKALTLEELLNIEVTSVSRREEKLSEVASAIQVITNEQIRRSGATSIPEALRLASNLHVAQKNSQAWAISARGFNTDLANKLLVLIDGRTVYTPLFSGVFWDRQDYLLEDIERIEVISGPGGTLWGANAVNGVINIITKNPGETQGLYAEAGGGSQLRFFTGVRYGGKISENTSFRVYGKYFDRDDAVFPDGQEASDSWRVGQAGFSVNAKPSEKNNFTLQGDYYGGKENISTGGTGDISGGNVLARWSHIFSDRADMRLQLYYDKTYLLLPLPEQRTQDNTVLAPAGDLKDNLDTYDVDFQHRLQLGERNQVVWGLGYRFTHNVVNNAPALVFEPGVLDRNLFSVFAQDKIKLSQGLSLTIGTKVEHNDYTGFEFEPGARLQSMISDRQMVWAGVSRAVRMPSRVDRHIRLPTPGLSPVLENLLIGGADFESENVLAYELGYRVQVGSGLSGSLATFYNVYDDVRSTSLSPPDPTYGLVFPLFYANNLEGETYGLEVTMNYTISDWWRLFAGYSLLNADIRVKKGEYDFNNALNETADPQHQFSLRSNMNISRKLELYLGFRWIDSFTYNNSGVPVKANGYHELDARLGWHLTDKLELSVTGQNLLQDHHREYVISGSNLPADVERSVYAKLACRF